mmetsp:Transcript_25503/g.61313  ORF Transcript_25503/g.61313 Transcript_25503/m.61313 type:complete len:309 (+) Transcript_25503:118-1044(+)|eukprot:CAMPEP_0181104908 /NCGR_PEP_ID=MMETSP1071-20121207/15683_1 /TAXON_ID=35127 /ORGANISM="Thalassiosira sp., Strain NH16" /LENGTH=308 /DNA_ID=CAMNT_0023188147 /DNA_START=119 /DNA_END=1045 /DNA_ORIENTATION=-
MDGSSSEPEPSGSQPSSSVISPAAKLTVASKKRRKTSRRVNSEEVYSSNWAKVPKSTPRGATPEMKAAYAELRSAASERSSAQTTLESARTALEEAKRQLLSAEGKSEEAEDRFHRARSAFEELDLQKPDGRLGRWNEMFSKLEAFKEQHGHLRFKSVPEFASDPELKKLSNFLIGAKAAYNEYQNGKRSTNRPHRMIALERLGVFKGKWEEKYSDLIEYKRVHGHCNVPTRSKKKEYQKLGNWVGWNRVEYKKHKDGKDSTITEERIKLLEDIGFCFNLFEAKGIVRKRKYGKKAEEAETELLDNIL